MRASSDVCTAAEAKEMHKEANAAAQCVLPGGDDAE
jgi:hypothetical protein